MKKIIEWLVLFVAQIFVPLAITYYVKEHSDAIYEWLIENTVDDATCLSMARVFSEESGNYGTGLPDAIAASNTWNDTAKLANLYINRLGYTYGDCGWSLVNPDLFRENLRDVDIAIHSRSSNLYGVLDNDDQFSYLGGLALAETYQKSVEKYGVTCCHHTCGNPLLQDYIQGILSVPEQPPEQRTYFRARGGGARLAEAETEEEMGESLANMTETRGVSKTGEELKKPPEEASEKKGKVMKEEKTEKPSPASPISGAPLMGIIAVIVVLVLIGIGLGLKRRKR